MIDNNRKILIVEDDYALQLLYKLKFKHEGFDVSSATNGNDGYKLAKSFEPDIMLVDLLLPGMNGTEMLSLIRSHQWGSNIRIVVITNISRDEAPQALRFFNVDRYIVKAHFTPAQVVDVVRDVLGDKP